MSNKSELDKFLGPKYKALDLVKQVLESPYALAILQEYFTSAKPTPSPAWQQEPVDTIEEKTKGSLAVQVEAACESFGIVEFTARSVITLMESNGYKFSAADKLVAVNTVLKRLLDRNRLSLVHRGKGQKPSRYKYIHRFPRTNHALQQTVSGQEEEG